MFNLLSLLVICFFGCKSNNNIDTTIMTNTPLTTEDAFIILKKANFISDKLDLLRTKNMDSYLLISSNSNRNELFKRLINESENYEGKIYGLLGLYEYDIDNYYLLKKKFDLEKKISLCIADTVRTYEVSEIIKNIENGKIIKVLMWMPSGTKSSEESL